MSNLEMFLDFDLGNIDYPEDESVSRVGTCHKQFITFQLYFDWP